MKEKRAIRIRFIHQYFHPDLSSVSRVISQIAFDLAAGGADVSVICSRNKYDGVQGGRLPSRERIGGVDILRCWGPSFGRGTLAASAADMLSFCLAGTVRALFSRKADTVVLLTNPPFYASVGALLKRLKGERFVYVLMDVYPDIAIRSGVIREGGRVDRFLRRFARAIFGAADAIVVLGEDMRAVAVRSGADPAKVRVITNWADPSEIRPVAPPDNPLREAWGFEGKFVVEYSGNLGVAHSFDEFLDVAASLADHPAIRFLVVGGGKRIREVERFVAERKLPNVSFKHYQEAALLSESLSVGDVHYVSLRPGFEGLVVPSKAYGIMAAGRPILYQGAEDGEIARMIDREGIGHIIPPGDREQLRARVLGLYEDGEKRLQMGADARRALEARYCAATGLSAYRSVLAGAA